MARIDYFFHLTANRPDFSSFSCVNFCSCSRPMVVLSLPRSSQCCKLRSPIRAAGRKFAEGMSPEQGCFVTILHKRTNFQSFPSAIWKIAEEYEVAADVPPRKCLFALCINSRDSPWPGCKAEGDDVGGWETDRLFLGSHRHPTRSDLAQPTSNNSLNSHISCPTIIRLRSG